MAQRSTSVPVDRNASRMPQRFGLPEQQRFEERAQQTISLLTTHRAQESSAEPVLTFDRLVDHNISHRLPTTRVRVRDLAGRELCLAGHLHADPPGSVPAVWTVQQARYSSWCYLRTDQNGRFMSEGYVDLREYEFTYNSRVLARADILGTLPEGAIVIAVRPNGRPPLGEGTINYSEQNRRRSNRHTQEPSPSPPTTPPTPPMYMYDI